MKKNAVKKVAVVSLSLFVAACANNNMDINLSKGEAIGAGLGAIVGGVVGYQFGAGIGQALATTAGVLLGGSGGYVLGRRLGPSDQVFYDNSAKKALSSASDGEFVAWNNTETGSSGIFKTTRSFRSGQNEVCRGYRATVSVEKDLLKEVGTACQMANGEWLSFPDETG